MSPPCYKAPRGLPSPAGSQSALPDGPPPAPGWTQRMSLRSEDGFHRRPSCACDQAAPFIAHFTGVVSLDASSPH